MDTPENNNQDTEKKQNPLDASVAPSHVDSAKDVLADDDLHEVQVDDDINEPDAESDDHFYEDVLNDPEDEKGE